jgi:hypothetical protein
MGSPRHAATQSHSLEFTAFPARRIAWSGPIDPNKLSHVIGPVHVHGRDYRHCGGGPPGRPGSNWRAAGLRPFEKVEFSRAVARSMAAREGVRGILADVEAGHPHTVHYAKASVAELAESILTRLCRVIGGSTLSRHSPYGYWAQDVKALGFLRPPWPWPTTCCTKRRWAKDRAEEKRS